MALLAVAALFLTACNPEMADQDYSMVNSLRSGVGVAQLSRASELDLKAQVQADRMAQQGRIFHSQNLADGVSPGWSVIGENVAVAGSIEAAQRALENSPDHYTNMTNPKFTEMGVGVTVVNGNVYVAQVFVGR